MEVNINGLGWLGFCLVIAAFIYVNHKQYMAGHNNYIFEHKTEDEKRIREAQIRILEQQAGIKHVSKPQETNSDIQHGSTH